MKRPSYTKGYLAEAIKNGTYSLKKRNVSVEQESEFRSAMQLFVSEIYTISIGSDIPKNVKPIPGWVVASDGVILVKNAATTNILNYLGKCSAITLADREKQFKKGMNRNVSLKRGRRFGS